MGTNLRTISGDGAMNKNIDYSIVVPVFNSENTLEELVERVGSVFKGIRGCYELILVDDGSIDGSWQKMKELHEKDGRTKIIRLTRNFGQHNALMCGFSQAHGNYILIMDDDLQNPPEEIPKLIKKIEENYLVVYGDYEIKMHGIIENILSRIFNKLKHDALQIPENIHTSNFLIIKYEEAKKMASIKTAYPFLAALIFKNVPTSKIANVKVVHSERKIGRSNYNFIKYIRFSSNLLINHSFLPIFFIWCSGILSTILGISLIMIKFAADFFHHELNFGSLVYLIISLILLGGLILISLGILGEYLRRILNELFNEPQYVIDELVL